MRVSALAVGMLAAGLTLVAPQSAAAAESGGETLLAEGREWSVEQLSGGYRLTLDLDQPLPVRASAPVLYADGEAVGAATESADGLSLSVVTADPGVVETARVDYRFDTAGGTSAAYTAEGTSLEESLEAIEDDPAVVGEYAVGRADYDFGTQAIDLKEIGGIKGEFRAAVYEPRGASGARPVVVLLHGRHTSCSGRPSNPNRYPCTDAQTEIPSFEGYGYLAENLASHGYVVVSVSANAINSNDNQLSDDYGSAARGHLVMDHLRYLAKVDAGTATDAPEALAALKGRLDLSNVGIMGHSRGGEGVVRAAELNQAEGEPFGIRSVLPLAPVDYNRITLPQVNTLAVLPYCDGDVEDLQGQHIIDDSMAASSDEALRSAVLLMGANHNFFNTVWTPGQYDLAVSDDWAILDRSQTDPVCGTAAETNIRLSDQEQRDAGIALMAGWFRLTLGDDEQFLTLFDGTGGTTETLGDTELVATAQLPASGTRTISVLGAPSTAVRTTGAATSATCSTTAECGLPGANVASIPHWAEMRFAPATPGAAVRRYSWTEAGSQLVVDVPRSARDTTGLDALTFRMTPDTSVAADADLEITVVDGANRTATVTASTYSTAVRALPGTGPYLNKVILRGVRVPLADLVGVDLADLRQVRLGGIGASGGAYLADLAFSASQAGTTTSARALPKLTVGDSYIDEGDGPGTTELAIKLSAPASTDVTGWFEVLNFARATSATPVARQFTIPAGRTCVALPVPVNGNRNPAAAATTSYIVNASVVAGAVTADHNARLTVREDDAVVVDGIVLDLAEEPTSSGDVCAGENRAATRLAVTASGSTVAGAVVALAGDEIPTGSLVYSVAGDVVGESVLDARGRSSFTLPRATDGGLRAGSTVIDVEYVGDASHLGSSDSVTAEVAGVAVQRAGLRVARVALRVGRPGTVVVRAAQPGTVKVVVARGGTQRVHRVELTAAGRVVLKVRAPGSRPGQAEVTVRLTPSDAAYTPVQVVRTTRVRR
ncbi:poly(ethylene terephthalate) hydrolase family protein [Nocardioides pacificus]